MGGVAGSDQQLSGEVSTMALSGMVVFEGIGEDLSHMSVGYH